MAIGEVARPHGVAGELRIKLYNEESRILARGVTVVLTPKGRPVSEGRPVRIEALRQVPGAPLIRLADVSGRDAAEALRGATLSVPRSQFPPLEEGEFYACDVEGAEARLADGTRVGTVRALVDYPTCQALLVEKEGGGELEVPVREDFIVRIDPAQPAVIFQGLGELE